MNTLQTIVDILRPQQVLYSFACLAGDVIPLIQKTTNIRHDSFKQLQTAFENVQEVTHGLKIFKGLSEYSDALKKNKESYVPQFHGKCINSLDVIRRTITIGLDLCSTTNLMHSFKIINFDVKEIVDFIGNKSVYGKKPLHSMTEISGSKAVNVALMIVAFCQTAKTIYNISPNRLFEPGGALQEKINFFFNKVQKLESNDKQDFLNNIAGTSLMGLQHSFELFEYHKLAFACRFANHAHQLWNQWPETQSPGYPPK